MGAVQILIRWPRQKPADLDLRCFLKLIYIDSAEQGLIQSLALRSCVFS